LDQRTINQPAAEVTRLICASVSQVQGSVMTEMFAIRASHCKSVKSGAASPIRAALLHVSGWFVLWLEGPEEAVEEARRRAAQDPRNNHQKVIHKSRGPATLTESLSVATTQLPISPSVFGHHVLQIRSHHAEPAALWQRLCAPCIAGPTSNLPAVPHQHVALLAADDNGPIDLLRSLGERNGASVAYQRFASGNLNSADVGVAYVDLRMKSCTRRILLLSRRALGYALVRQSLVGLDALVLVLGNRQSAATELAHGVANCLEAIGRQPTVHLVGEDNTVAQPVEDVLRSRTRTARLNSDRLDSFLQSCSAAAAAPTAAATVTAVAAPTPRHGLHTFRRAIAQELQTC
jgi:hypothetical protein